MQEFGNKFIHIFLLQERYTINSNFIVTVVNTIHICKSTQQVLQYFWVFYIVGNRYKLTDNIQFYLYYIYKYEVKEQQTNNTHFGQEVIY